MSQGHGDALAGPGQVVGIFTAPREGAPVEPRREVRASPGRGLEGDRYYDLIDDRGEARDLTLISEEDIERARTEHGLDLEPGEHRRNLVVRGLDLSGLVGRRLSMGDVRVEIMKLNPPCRYLQDLTGKPVLKALKHAGGVRGAILTEGTIAVGDAVTPE